MAEVAGEVKKLPSSKAPGLDEILKATTGEPSGSYIAFLNSKHFTQPAHSHKPFFYLRFTQIYIPMDALN